MNASRPMGTPKPKISRIEVYWHAVTYRTVLIYLLILVSVVSAAAYMVYPDWVLGTVLRVTNAISGGASAAKPIAPTQAHFVNLDGKVLVKKANAVEWVLADFHTTLDKGDLIQTGPDGAARLAFGDGTNYTVKAETLVTVEENSVARDSSTRVGVHISSGAVDLSTGNFNSPKSKAEVSFADAVASLRENSRAAVRSDPQNNQNEITLSAGSAEVRSSTGQEKIELRKWERASVTSGGSIVKTAVLAPPDLTQPVNLQPIIVADPRRAPVRFEWRTVPGAASYDLRISATSMFTKVLVERHTTATSAEVTGLDAGEYFWSVTAYDAEKRASEPSDSYKFTLVAQDKSEEMRLEVDSTELHGNVVEIVGRTEAGAALIINGQPVANIQPDGRFRYFTEPLTRGSQTIVITGQNRRGGIAIKRVPIVIP